jgi:hypothetical protein
MTKGATATGASANGTMATATPSVLTVSTNNAASLEIDRSVSSLALILCLTVLVRKLF